MLPPPVIVMTQILGLPAEEPLSVEADFFAAGGTSLQVGAVRLPAAVASPGSPHTQSSWLQGAATRIDAGTMWHILL
jgi:hypothetical protein